VRAVIGLVLLVTAATRFCLIYAALGLSTAEQQTEDEAVPASPRGTSITAPARDRPGGL
jgi:hypothetical protein